MKYISAFIIIFVFLSLESFIKVLINVFDRPQLWNMYEEAPFSDLILTLMRHKYCWVVGLFSRILTGSTWNKRHRHESRMPIATRTHGARRVVHLMESNLLASFESPLILLLHENLFRFLKMQLVFISIAAECVCGKSTHIFRTISKLIWSTRGHS